MPNCSDVLSTECHKACPPEDHWAIVRTRSLAAVLALVAALSGCASSTNAVVDSLRYAVQADNSIDQIRLNPNFRYLKAVIQGRSALLVLGYIEADPQGPIEVWYSAKGEVVRIQNGRIAGAVGLTTEWRSVSLPKMPPWSTLARDNRVFQWARVRDVMPGYRVGVKDNLVLRTTPPPAQSAIQGVSASDLTWFEETQALGDGPTASGEDVLPRSRYAVAIGTRGETVVYGEQCLAPKLCFTWQRWPAEDRDPKEAK